MNWDRKIATRVDIVLLVSSVLAGMGAFGLMEVAHIRLRGNYNEDIVSTLAENSYLALLLATVLVLMEVWYEWRCRRALRKADMTCVRICE